jgi:hypothetical protein
MKKSFKYALAIGIIKKVVLLIFLFSNYSFSQEMSKHICYNVDEFTDEKNLSAGSSVYYTDGGNLVDEGILFQLVVLEGQKKKDGIINEKRIVLIGEAYGIGNCVDEGSKLNIIFEDGSKTELVNFNEFDCDGTNYFRISDPQIKLFIGSPIKAIRYTNTRNYESLVVKENLSDKNKVYLQERLKEVKEINSRILNIGICEEE